MSTDMNQVEHIWDDIKRKVNQRNPQSQNISKLINTIVEEWWWFPQEIFCHLVRGRNSRVWDLWCKRGGYTRYWVNVRKMTSPYTHSSVLKNKYGSNFCRSAYICYNYRMLYILSTTLLLSISLGITVDTATYIRVLKSLSKLHYYKLSQLKHF